MRYAVRFGWWESPERVRVQLVRVAGKPTTSVALPAPAGDADWVCDVAYLHTDDPVGAEMVGDIQLPGGVWLATVSVTPGEPGEPRVPDEDQAEDQ